MQEINLQQNLNSFIQKLLYITDISSMFDVPLSLNRVRIILLRNLDKKLQQ